MSSPGTRSPAAEPASVVRDFYRAMSEGDGVAIRALVRERFADGATLCWPESLPYGGSLSGRTKLERVLGAATDAVEPAGVRNLRLTGLVDGGDRVAAQLEFDWYSAGGVLAVAGTGAVELWTFASGRVTEIKAYYWDTAVLGLAAGEPG
ncbi:nuclear transport factor 2 family protein [Spirillospora sp. CA-255316]